MWIVAESMKKLAGNIPDNYTVLFGACTQEETGLNGAKRMAKNLNPDLSIDVDCTFADSELAGKDFKDLDINLGDGALIAYGPEKSKRLCKLLKDTAKLNSIPFKTYATRAGGTNTKSFQDFTMNCECALISYGLLSMHSSNEIVKESDLRNCSDLITYLIKDQVL
jgi:putative aminopeptidase FrvX